MLTEPQKLDQLIELVDDRLPDVSRQLHATLHKGQKRKQFGDDVTVVALAGGTGAGKSSLFNALLGADIARTSPLRPTTSRALAVSNVDAGPLLQWLGISERHLIARHSRHIGETDSATEASASHEDFRSAALNADFRAAPPLVLIDLPDVDSHELANREIAARLAACVDVVVWVLDPQKYADAVIHEEYLSQLSEHAEVTLAVLNHIDRLSASTREQVLGDARRLLKADGMDINILGTSAISGEGVSELRAQIYELAAGQWAARERRNADIRAAARAALGEIRASGGVNPRDVAVDLAPVARSWAQACGAEVVAQAAGDSYYQRACRNTGWPVTRWLARRKINPLRRLRIVGNDSQAVAPVTGVRHWVSPAQQVHADNQLHEYIAQSVAGLPKTWRAWVHTKADRGRESFIADTDSVIVHSDVEYRRRPVWWTLVNLMQCVALLCVLIGAGWLILRMFADTLQLRLGQVPGWGIFPLPTVLLIGGLLLGWGLALVGRVLAARGRKRTIDRVRRRLEAAIGEQVYRHISVPVREELECYAQIYQTLGQLTKYGR
ncbi:dynamin family protein [Trueperella sp. LYQ141]|uniref:dynamin family protein n=1 Tax=Trueperella sp. LYQ141 TaxID=3391058 RepID=UPI003983251F